MTPSVNSAFILFDLFSIFGFFFLSHVFFTLSSKEKAKSAEKSLKIFKTLIYG